MYILNNQLMKTKYLTVGISCKIVLCGIIVFQMSMKGACQNAILNGGFESYESCPEFLYQDTLVDNWCSVIHSSDYYNCGFFDDVFGTDGSAASGTGFMGFARGTLDGYAEAIGQVLETPLFPGNEYDISFAARQSNDGLYNQSCEGIALYGFETLPDTAFVHVSTLNPIELLVLTDVIDHAEWQIYNFTFTPQYEIKSLVFTTELSFSDCLQCVFIDDVSLKNLTSSVSENDSVDRIDVFPNPTKDVLFFNSENIETIQSIHIANTNGQIVKRKRGAINQIDISELETGVYTLYFIFNNGVTFTEKIVKI